MTAGADRWADPAFRPRYGLVGLGRVGETLARALFEVGEDVAAVSSRRPHFGQEVARDIQARFCAEAAGVAHEADLVLLTVLDDSITAVAQAVAEAGGWQPGQAVIHCSGALTREALAPAHEADALTGSLHPLLAFATAAEALRLLPGVTWAVEAEPRLVQPLERLARLLGGEPIIVPADKKVLYHASAVLASNYLVTLLWEGAGLWESFGIAREEAARALLTLVRGTVRNVERGPLARSLTGPIARGDAGTIARHLAALAESRPDLAHLYRELGRDTLPISAAQGIATAEQLEAVRRLFEDESTVNRQLSTESAVDAGSSEKPPWQSRSVDG